MSAEGALPPLLAPFVLDASALVIEDTVLGSGSYGKVFRGSYKAQPVCVKVRLPSRPKNGYSRLPANSRGNWRKICLRTREWYSVADEFIS